LFFDVRQAKGCLLKTLLKDETQLLAGVRTNIKSLEENNC
jgi:hypothetical protein